MNDNDSSLGNWLARHPRKTITIFLIISFIFLDVLAANVYRWIEGHPWNKSTDEIERSYRIPSEIYNHDLAPKMSVDNARWGPITYRVRTNSLGFKDRNTRNVPLVSDKHRIIFMGDSFTEGNGVEYEHTFVGLIDSALSEKGIEVLNAAVSGYSTIIYWRKTKYLVEEIGLKFDELVVFLDLSDACNEIVTYYLDDSSNVHYNFNGAGDNTNDFIGEGLAKGIKGSIRKNTILSFTLLNAIRHLYFSAITAQKRVIDHKKGNWTVNEDSYKEYGQGGNEKMEMFMSSLFDMLEKHSITLSVAVYPWPDQIFYNDLNSLHVSIWRDWCHNRNVRFLNYFPYFVKGTQKEREQIIDRYFIDGDYHFNEEGHRLIADVFLDFYGDD